MSRATCMGWCHSGARAAGLTVSLTVAMVEGPGFGQHVCWDNDIVPNGFNARATSPPAFPGIRVVGDFTTPTGVELVGLRTAHVEDIDWVAEAPVEVYVYGDSGAQCPGVLVTSLLTSDVVREAQDYQLFDREVYEYWVTFDPVALGPGRYHIGSRWPNAGGAGTTYWLTSNGGEGVEFVDCFNLGEWTDPGPNWHMAFELTCAADPPVTGACCLPDSSCVVVGESLCAAIGGEYRGDDVSCDDADCSEPATGACCFPSGACEVLSDATCVDAGGTYRGDDVTCKEADCPPPPPSEPCWDNDIVPNGFNARATSPPAFPQVRVAADFGVPPNGITAVTLRQANVEDADWIPVLPVEVFVYAAGGACPGELLLSFETAEVIRSYQGYQLFDRDVYEHWITFDPIAFDEGRYYIGSRWPHAKGVGTTYWLTSSGRSGSDRTDCFSLDEGENWGQQGPDWHMAFELLCEGAPPACPDLDGDEDVDMDDLAILIDAWGDEGGPADLDGDGLVGWSDLLLLLSAWGPCS